MSELHVHVGFGFHVNCYHSYRGDTPDALGFGGDIRIMRHILDTLDAWNAKGVPVRGTWDFENAYSLEKILPEYAPDIIERVRARGDENILMGYNNGAMSAMTADEFDASVNWAITNPYHSGLQDIFGGCEMIIRPQEVMFTPSQAAAYTRLGVKAVCLYYSCISFDAFRTLIPPLPDEHAFNPLRYVWQDGSITVLPTYSPNDIMDAGSLRALVYELHDKQRRGEITHDVFIFINTDADSFLWEPMAAPMNRLPCFGGIGGYIKEIADLPFVRFDTPGGYLRDHAPLREIRFGQDVADGNLSGYMSWSEKPFNRLIWTRLERARRMAQRSGRDCDSPSFETRVRLLSTTHFGLASPVMNITREEKARALSETMLQQEQTVLPQPDLLTLCDPEQAGLAAVQLALKDGFCDDVTKLHLSADGLGSWTACETGRYESGCISSIYLVARFAVPQAEYRLQFSVGEAKKAEMVLPAAKDLRFELYAGKPRFRLHETDLALLRSWIEYDGKRVPFGPPSTAPLPLAGDGAGIRLSGEIHLPGEQNPGSYVFDLFRSPAADCILVRTAVQYPYTTEDHEISSQASNLGRYSDNKWTQTAPFELLLRTDDSVRVTKRSFAGAISDYPMSDFWNAYPQNENISSINHQLTGGTLCVAEDRGGLLLAHARQVLGSMAHCPLRLRSRNGKRYVNLNPFGTYFGPQRYYPTRGNGSSMELYLAAAPQARSLAPAYNGAFEQSVSALFGTLHSAPTEDQQRTAEAIADGVIALGGTDVTAFSGDNVKLHDPVDNKVDPKQLKSVTFVEQAGGVKPLIGMVKRTLQNIHNSNKRLRKLEKE